MQKLLSFVGVFSLFFLGLGNLLLTVMDEKHLQAYLYYKKCTVLEMWEKFCRLSLDDLSRLFFAGKMAQVKCRAIDLSTNEDQLLNLPIIDTIRSMKSPCLTT